MNAKEYAQQLVDKYKPYVYCYMGSGMLTNTENEEVIVMHAKSCAKIAIDEVLSVIMMLPKSERKDNFFNLFEEVKQEIQNL